MSAPLFLAPAGSLAGVVAGSAVELVGDEGRHAARVRRIGAGERVDVADGEGVLAHCVVTAAGRDALTLEVVGRVELPAPQPRFVLVQALAKSGRDDLAVETATELGVDEVVPWQADRSVVQWRGDRGAKARLGWVSTARSASKQSRRPRVPVVGELADRAALLRRVAAASLAVVLHEEATEPLAGVPLPAAGDVLLVVGPEGGITPDEVAALVAAGARSCRLGDTVLRSSTAGPAAIAMLSARRRWQ